MTEIVKLVDKHSDEEVEPTSLSGVWTLLHCLLYFNYVMTVGQKESDKNEKQCALSDGCSRVEIQIPDECVCVCVLSRAPGTSTLNPSIVLAQDQDLPLHISASSLEGEK